jgi:quinol monooxygenase YgiN
MSRRAAAILIAALLWVFPIIPVSADTIPGQFVLVVDLEIEPAELAAFKVAIKEIGEIIVRIEPGCQAFSAVFEKEHPTRVRLFEIYENAEAFNAYLQTPQFQKFGEMIKGMIISRKLVENVPITLNMRAK